MMPNARSIWDMVYQECQRRGGYATVTEDVLQQMYDEATQDVGDVRKKLAATQTLLAGGFSARNSIDACLIEIRQLRYSQRRMVWELVQASVMDRTRRSESSYLFSEDGIGILWPDVLLVTTVDDFQKAIDAVSALEKRTD